MFDRSSVIKGMNRLTREKSAQVVASLVERNSIRATWRVTGAAKGTVLKRLIDFGAAGSAYQDAAVRNLKSCRIQCDEIWSFVGMKAKNVPADRKAERIGDMWTRTAPDADTKLVPFWVVGCRDSGTAYAFIQALTDRLANRVQMTTNGHRVYLSAIETAFGADIDYPMLNKLCTVRSRPERPATARPSASGRSRAAALAIPIRRTSLPRSLSART